MRIFSTYLMDRFPKRYKSQKPVVSNKTGKAGRIRFKLGPKEYKITAEKCSFPMCWKGEARGKVIVNSTTRVKLNVSVDYGETIVLWLIIVSIGGIIVAVVYLAKAIYIKVTKWKR